MEPAPEATPKFCSRCNNAWYCNVDCQRAHWPAHRPFCAPPPVRERVRQAAEIALDGAHYRVLNPRADRSLFTHGDNLKRRLGAATAGIEALVRGLGGDIASARDLFMLDANNENIGEYGLSVATVAAVVEKHGGRSVCGWCFWENRFTVKAEAYCAWEDTAAGAVGEGAAARPRVINVTLGDDDWTFSALFLEDPIVDAYVRATGKFPSNVIYWKQCETVGADAR